MIAAPTPPPPPEPVPDSLDEPVDWMTYTHQELYRMVHSGLDLAGATAVAANWARLGDALGEIGDELNRIVQDFTHAWQGDAADQAVHAVSSLATWSTEAGGLATDVSGCVTIEVDNAMRARNAMPAPIEPPERRFPDPVPVPMPAFATAPMLATDRNAFVSQQYAAHKQAAETMEQFQTESRDVYHAVPRFSAPKVGPKPLGSPDNPPAPPPQQPTTPQEASPPPAPGPVRGPGGAAPVPAGGPAPAPAPAPAPGPGAVPGHPVAQPVEGRPSGAAPAAASAAPKSGGGAPMGGMPMGGMGAPRKEEDLERKSPSYVKGDGDLWGLDEHVVAPPVIGEDQGRRA